MVEEKTYILTVVIPALNEERGIQDIVQRVLEIRPALLEAGLKDLEIIVVDDGSSDHTGEVVTSIPGVRLVKHPVNRGYGAALKTGFQAATGNLLGFLDADGTYPPEFFPNLCQAAMQGADLVVGSRRSGEKSEMPFIRKIGNFIWSNLVSLIGNQLVFDPASGMRVIRRESLEHLYPLPDGLNFTPVMSTRAVHEGLKMVEIPIPYKERVGRSKLRVVRDGVNFLNTIIWTALNYNPSRILGSIAVFLAAISFLIFLAIVFMRISGKTTLGLWGSAGLFTMVVLGITALNFFSLGIIFNYLVSLFHKKPIRQGLFGRPIFKIPLDKHFGWFGLVSVLLGSILGIISFILSTGGWSIERLWLYLLFSTLLMIGGLQLIVFYVICRVLEQLSQREDMVQKDLGNLNE